MAHESRFRFSLKFFVLLLVVIVGAAFFARLKVVSRGIDYLGVPLRAAGGLFWKLRLSTGNFISPYRDAQDLRVRLEESEQAVHNLTEKQVNLLELERENIALRQILDFHETEGYPLVVSRITGQLPENAVNFFILNRGTNFGVRPDAAVVTGNTLIGKIVKTSPRSSLAVPLTSPTIKTAASLAGIEKTTGIVEGEHNLTLVMRLIPKDITVLTGRPVITSGLEEGIPRGLLIGTVERVEIDAQGLFQSAYINAPKRFANSVLVGIVK